MACAWQSRNLIQPAPPSQRKTSKPRGSQRGEFLVRGQQDRTAKNICLKLHEFAVARCTAIGEQSG